MIRLAIPVLALAALAYASPVLPSGLDDRIIGGEEVDIEEVPYTVAVLLAGSHFCGGTIISPKHILTAAHCIYGFHRNLYSVRYGSAISDKGGVVVNVLKITEHPEYNSTLQNNDIAVLELVTEIKFSTKVHIAKLASEEPEDGEQLLVLGWGVNKDGKQDKELLGVTVPAIERTRCKDLHYDETVTESMICAGYEDGGQDACGGDSGGPLMNSNTEIVGVVSWGKGCARPNKPGVYSNVAKLRSFIEEHADV